MPEIVDQKIAEALMGRKLTRDEWFKLLSPKQREKFNKWFNEEESGESKEEN